MKVCMKIVQTPGTIIVEVFSSNIIGYEQVNLMKKLAN